MIRHGILGSNKMVWDGIWRVVVFDVPNEKTKVRNELRRAMKLYGFKLLQRSVWVYPYKCNDFTALLKSHLGTSNDVLYMEVKYIENDRLLRKEFAL
jgi:phenylacetic acid degradation operon negative regulatory protein